MRFPNLFLAEKKVNELETLMNLYLPFYAIRHKPTGRFLPDVRGNTRTWVEPTHPKEAIPRLFFDERTAKSFLTVWCKGPLQLKKFFIQDWETGVHEEYGMKHYPDAAKEPRIKSEYEIVKIFWGVVE